MEGRLLLEGVLLKGDIQAELAHLCYYYSHNQSVFSRM